MEERFATSALERGAAHAVRGDVRALTWDAGTATLTGTVREEGGREFRALVQFLPSPREDGLEYELSGSICTCEDGDLCAHASGLLHAFDIVDRGLGAGLGDARRGQVSLPAAPAGPGEADLRFFYCG